jgi:hypothetical protein
MSSLRIREFLERLPFVPFTVYTADGSTVRVRSPEFALVDPNGRTLTVTTGEQVDAHSEVQVIDILQITKLSVLEPPQLVSDLTREPVH